MVSFSPNPVARSYCGAANQCAMALNLPEHIIKMGDRALEVLTSAAPLINDMDRIAGIGYGGPADHSNNLSPSSSPSNKSGRSLS